MQQTEQYQLNLIDTSDNFSPEPLNENMEKVEGELSRLDEADAAQTAARDALDQRVTALEVHKMVAGSYMGNGTSQTINLGFTPVAVLAIWQNFYDFEICAVAITDSPALGHSGGQELYIVPNGFTVGYPSGSAYLKINQNNHKYHYLAFV